jgi:multicomponent Na+:H+ antiporter subunit A
MTEVLALLILLTIAAAIVTMVTTNLLYAVISVSAVGFLLAILYMFLAAPDIAIVQIGVEVISLVILIRATLGRDALMEATLASR